MKGNKSDQKQMSDRSKDIFLGIQKCEFSDEKPGSIQKEGIFQVTVRLFDSSRLSRI